jgi:hypothetical protein
MQRQKVTVTIPPKPFRAVGGKALFPQALSDRLHGRALAATIPPARGARPALKKNCGGVAPAFPPNNLTLNIGITRRDITHLHHFAAQQKWPRPKLTGPRRVRAISRIDGVWGEKQNQVSHREHRGSPGTAPRPWAHYDDPFRIPPAPATSFPHPERRGLCAEAYWT